MTQKKSIKSLVSIVLVSLCCMISLFISLDAENDIYKLIWILPIAYSICFTTMLYPMVTKHRSIFTITLLIMSFIRYVMLPAGMVLASKYSGKSPSDPSLSSVNTAVFMMIYELVALSMLLFHLTGKQAASIQNLKNDEQEEKLFSNQDYKSGFIVFGAFFALTIALVAMIPHTIQNFNFITPTDSTTKNMVSIRTIEQISTVCLSVTKQFCALFIAFRCYEKYQLTRNNIWSSIALIAMLLNACIYTGTNRSDFILMVIASFVIYTTLFPSKKRQTTIIMVALLGVAVPALSAYRKAGIIDTNSGVQGVINSFTDIMWGYSGGPYNVAIAYEAAHMYPEGRNILNFFYDFLRPTFGLNLLMQKIHLTYSNVYFNYRYYMEEKVTQILPMVGEGYFYFGIIGCPIITMIFGWLGIKLSTIRKMSTDPFVVYFLTITCCRLGFIMGQNATIQMNDLSFNLFVPLLLIYFSKKLKTN